MSYDVFISYNTKDTQIAEMAYHFIEARQLRCFFAPRNITEPDWAAKIYNVIINTKAFVIIVSKNSLNSMEVAKEIALATNHSEYIFPLCIDESDIDGGTAYHLAPFNRIDAKTPPIEKKLIELADRVSACLQGNSTNLGNRNNGRQRLISKTSDPRSEFIGRERELSEIHELFLSGANAVFLAGMGGIGKSEIAKTYAQKHRDLYTTVVFASYETDLLHLITNDQMICVENLQQASATGGQGETTEAYFARKMKVLQSIVNQNTLLIIDNFDVESDEHLEDVLHLPCKILLTTRTDFSAYGYYTVDIGPLENFEDLVTLMLQIGKIVRPDQQNLAAVQDIIRLLDCHTFAVSLTAAQMRAGNIRPVKMLAQLQEEGLRAKTRSSFIHNPGDKRSTAYQYIQSLFDFSRLGEADYQILRCLACMPRDGVDTDLFMECCDIEDFYDIGRLVDLNWVQLDRENDRLGLHMLVKELVWEQLTPTEDNCATMLQGAYRWAKNAWNKHYEENAQHSSIIYALLEAFRTPPIHWLDAFEDMATFAWIMGRFDLAERCEHHLYQLCVTHHGEVSVQAGNQALRVAAVYYNQGDYTKARPWYEKGLVVQESIDPNSVDAYVSRTKIARSNAQLLRYDIALADFEKNVSILQTHASKQQNDGPAAEKMYRHLIAAKLYLSLIYACVGRCEEALPLALEVYSFKKTDTKAPAGLVYALTTLTYIYQSTGDYEKAFHYAEEALEVTIRFHGENRIDVVLLQEMQGDLLAKKGRFPEAVPLYAKALAKREKLFPSDTAAIRQLEIKLTQAQTGTVSDVPFRIIWC